MHTLPESKQIRVYSTTKLVKIVNADFAADVVEIDVENLASGIYTIELVSESEAVRTQFIKR